MRGPAVPSLWHHAAPAKYAALIAPPAADNIYTLESWLKRKFEGMKEAVDGLFKEVSAVFPAAALQPWYCSWVPFVVIGDWIFLVP